MRTPPGASTAPFLLVTLALAACPVTRAAEAATDPVAINRAYFPERAWAPQTAADGGLVGAGRASDPLSSWVVNPALVGGFADSGRAQGRLGAHLFDPRRNDIAGASVDYSDTSPFLAIGETGFLIPAAGNVFLLAFDQPSFQKEETAFIDTSAGAAPTFRNNTARSSTQRLTAAVARPFGEWTASLAFHGVRASEAYETVPSQTAIGFGSVPGSLDLSGTGFCGALGVSGRPVPWLTAGAAYRATAAIDLEDADGNVVGHDEVPEGFDVGGTVGSGLGGNFSLGAAWTGERHVTLPDSLARGEEVSPARWSFAGGYTYRSRVAPWEFRAGFGWTPRPADGGGRSNRFGVGFGYDLSGVQLRGSFAGESLEDAAGDKSSRRFFTLSADFDL